MTSFEPQGHDNPTPVKKKSLQSIFMQSAAIPLFALIIYTQSKQLNVSLAVILLFYGNIFCMSAVLKFLGQGLKIFEPILIVNVSLILVGLVLVSLSMGGVLVEWAQSEKHWTTLWVTLFILYAVTQCAFVRQGLKLSWGWSSITTALTLLLNAAFCYVVFELFLIYN